MMMLSQGRCAERDRMVRPTVTRHHRRAMQRARTAEILVTKRVLSS